jgi:hypothetical protein
VTRADGTLIGQGSFSCNGTTVENRSAWLSGDQKQDWNGPRPDSRSTATEWWFRFDSNSGGRKTFVTVSCPGGNSKVDERDDP